MSELRERILAKAQYLKMVEFYVEEWDATVYFKELSGGDLAGYTKSSFVLNDKGEMQATDNVLAMVNILYYSMVDEDGKRLFNKTELKNMNATIVLKLGGEALKHSGLTTKTSMLEAKDELKKTVDLDSNMD